MIFVAGPAAFHRSHLLNTREGWSSKRYVDLCAEQDRSELPRCRQAAERSGGYFHCWVTSRGLAKATMQQLGDDWELGGSALPVGNACWGQKC